MRLLPERERPDRVLAMVTAGAEKNTWPEFREETQQILGVVPEAASIPDGRTPDELREILEHVAGQLPPGCDLSLDVTQGLRHFPFIVYALALYLTSLRGVRLRGAYYGMLEGTPPDQPGPIIDLRPLLEPPEWFHAVRVFRDQGIALPIARLIRPVIDGLRRTAQARNNDAALHRQASELEKAAVALERQSFAYGVGCRWSWARWHGRSPTPFRVCPAPSQAAVCRWSCRWLTSWPGRPKRPRSANRRPRKASGRQRSR